MVPLAPRRSTNASSSESGSTSGDRSRRMRMTWLLASRYAANLPLRYAACGQRRRASETGIAERTSLVGSGSHHTPGADASHHHRLAAQRRLVPLLDRSEKGVQVEMQHGRLATHKVILAFEWGGEAIA